MFKVSLITMFLSSSLWAQDAATPQATFMSFLPLVAIFFVFYFLMIRPQKKKMEEEQRYIAALKKGDEVITRSGLLGKIYGMTDTVVTLEIADNVKVKVLKSSIGASQQSLNSTESKAAAVQK